MPGTPRQTFRIEEILWRKFKEKCKRKGYNASSVLRAFIQQVLSGRMSIDTVKPAEAPKGQKLASFYDEFEKWLTSKK